MNATAKKLYKYAEVELRDSLVTKQNNDITYNDISDMIYYFENLFKNADGKQAHVIFAHDFKYAKEKEHEWQQWGIRLDKLTMQKLQNIVKEDVFVTVNSFFRTRRIEKHAREFHTIVLDFDMRHEGLLSDSYTAEELLDILEENNFFEDVDYSFAVDSGHGLHVYYLLDKCYYNEQMKHLRERIFDELVNKFRSLEIEDVICDTVVKDTTRVMRLPDSLNCKDRCDIRKVKLIKNERHAEPLRYTITELADKLLPFSREEVQAYRVKRSEKRKQVQIARREREKHFQASAKKCELTPRTLFLKRLEDIENLVEIRKDKFHTGTRNSILWLYGLYTTLYTKDIAHVHRQVMLLNDYMKDSIDATKVKYVILSCENVLKRYKDFKKKYQGAENTQFWIDASREAGIYRYRTKTIIEMLQVTEEEQEQLATFISKDEKKKRKTRTNNANYREEHFGDANKSKRDMIEEEKQKIRDLLTKGLKQKEICDMLQISPNTYKRRRKELKQEGLLP
ncbi:hypothetical protein [Bacillus cereus group sp. BfR-BA-01353]|uniref:hypothetical protein n=1 Tax=Bacillus cereus group sp. BfR-BA-01353 TaxID=2920316 RepID=UPI001F592383|nr:hypothetical protein [Bacillus cereus group sp. BfR-BA-01353]